MSADGGEAFQTNERRQAQQISYHCAAPSSRTSLYAQRFNAALTMSGSEDHAKVMDRSAMMSIHRAPTWFEIMRFPTDRPRRRRSCAQKHAFRRLRQGRKPTSKADAPADGAEREMSSAVYGGPRPPCGVLTPSVQSIGSPTAGGHPADVGLTASISTRPAHVPASGRTGPVAAGIFHPCVRPS